MTSVGGHDLQHQYGCPWDRSNLLELRSDVDAAILAGTGKPVRRAMRPAERAELCLATGRQVSRSEARRRWAVAVRVLPDGRRERVFLRDGQSVVATTEWFEGRP